MFFLIPHEVERDAANLWVGAVDEAIDIGQLTLQPQDLGHQTASAIGTWPQNRPRLQYREIRVHGLEPGRDYAFALDGGGRTLARARLRTLPDAIPLAGEKPFTVLLGSCFARHEDDEGKVGKAFFRIPHQARPDIKVLAGDQVYLDSPWQRFLRPYSEAKLREILFEHYVWTWGQTDGFAFLLRDGANYFCSDDHEFWNNAPNAGTVWVNTWHPDGRRQWWQIARELYTIFQTSKSVTTFTVPPVSFCIADTRINRSDNRTNFMLDADLQSVEQWIAALQGPGVLVIGQPLLQTTTGFFKGHFGDWNLPDYEQFHDLVRIIASSRHSLIVLTGDVHFGRIAHSKLRSGADLVEIISSPMSLVDERARGAWQSAPPAFPPVPPKSATSALLARAEVVTEPGFSPTDSHFLTLEFTRRGPGVALGVRYWPIGGGAPADFGKEVWNRLLR